MRLFYFPWSLQCTSAVLPVIGSELMTHFLRNMTFRYFWPLMASAELDVDLPSKWSIICLPLMSFSTRGVPAPRTTSAQVTAQLSFGLDQSAYLSAPDLLGFLRPPDALDKVSGPDTPRNFSVWTCSPRRSGGSPFSSIPYSFLAVLWKQRLSPYAPFRYQCVVIVLFSSVWSPLPGHRKPLGMLWISWQMQPARPCGQMNFRATVRPCSGWFGILQLLFMYCR